MAAPTNIDASTAIDIGTTLPYDTTQNVRDGSTTYTVWYKYTAQAGDNVIGVWGFGDLVGYSPAMVVHAFDPAHPGDYDWLTTYRDISAGNVPAEVPITPGETYFFQFVRNSSAANPAVLTLSVLRHTDLAAADGDILVNDDSDDLPLAILDPTDGSVKRFVQGFAAGEAGDVLPGSGIMCFENLDIDGAGTYGVTLYNPDFSVIANVAVDQGRQISSNRVDTFYLGERGTGGVVNARVTTISTAGTLGGTVWDLGSVGLLGLAPNADETILYYTQSGGTNQPVKRWDLVNNVALSNFAAGVSGYAFTQDILVLSDGSVLVGYIKTSAPKDGFVRRYASDGSTVQDYQLGSNVASASTQERLAHALDSPASFWVWNHLSGGISLFRNINVATGAETVSFQAMQFETGQYQGNETATPSARFGHSFSCPFAILMVASGGGTFTTPTPAGPSEPCCCSCDDKGTGGSGGGGTGDSGSSVSDPLASATGPILAAVDPTGWTPNCTGGGTVPTAADATDAESWVS